MDDDDGTGRNDDGNAMSVSSWGQEIDEQDGFEEGCVGFEDNMSQVGSDYSEYTGNEMFAHRHPLAAGECYADDDTKYNPSEMMLGPPPSAAIQFNYNFPLMPASTLHPPQHGVVAGSHRISAIPDLMPAPDIYNNQEELGGLGTSAVARCNTHQPQTSQNYIHPNMWYPNAPIGSYRSYGSHPYSRHFGSQFSHDHMMDMFQMSNSGREARNRAEKNRRDKLNGSIQELSTMVPHVAESPRRVDKTTVLRSAAHGLRFKYVFGKSLNSRSVETTDALMKILDSFFLTLTCNGHIVLVSSSIEEHLGHCQADLYGQNILHITHPEDHQMLKQKMIPSDIDNLFDIQPEDECTEPRQRTAAEEEEIDRRLREDKRSFTISYRLARSGPRSEATIYELVKIDGCFRRSDMAPRGLKTSTFPSTLQLMRRSRGRDDILPMHTISGNDIVLIAIARIVRPPVINRSMEANRLEYKTRHLIDGRIIDCDQRISLVAGYMTDEVRNLSPFTFMHQDDVRWVIVALRQMYDCNSSFGESTYRLFTGNGKIIYLHTKGFLEIDKNTNKVHSFICVNTLLDEEEGKRRVQNMKNKFSVIINTNIPQSSADVPASENPQQLEKAVMCLIQNLQHSSTVVDAAEAIVSASDYSDYSVRSQKKSYQEIMSHPTSSNACSGRSSKTPPLALVPPAPESIKNSITKSVCVVKTTAGKFLRAQNSGCSASDEYIDDNELPDGSCSDNRKNLNQVDCSEKELQSDLQTTPYYSSTTSTRALKRIYSSSVSEQAENEDNDYRVPMQRRDIENVLSTSLQQLDNKLNQQINKAIELRDTGQLYDLPHTDERFADIMNEHRKQRKMYKDITTEFEGQRQYECGSTSSSSNDNVHNIRKAIGNGVNETNLVQSQNSPPSTFASATLNQETDDAQSRTTDSDT